MTVVRAGSTPLRGKQTPELPPVVCPVGPSSLARLGGMPPPTPARHGRKRANASASSGPATMTHLPTHVMPVRAVFGMQVWHDHDVTESGRDRLVAARTEIRLARLVRLHSRDRDRIA